jgi:hypothetical protein
MPRGRPRGSGGEGVTLTWALSQDESRWFYAGYRNAEGPMVPEDAEDLTMAQLSPYLTSAERRQALAHSDEFVLCWAMIGIMQWHLDKCIAKIRGV